MIPSIEQNYKAFIKSQEILFTNQVTDFPLDIKKLIEENNIILSTVEEYKEFRLVTKETRPYIKIKEGRAIYDETRNIYLIAFVENIYYKRVRFTLAHEFGHIILKHLCNGLTEIDRGGISDELHAKLEDEADTFAGNLLVPPIIACHRIRGEKLNFDSVSTLFGISNSALIYYRHPDWLHWLNIEHSTMEKIVLNNYKNRKHPKHCETCGMQIFGKDIFFCPICGNELIENKGDYFVVYDRIDLNDRHKVKVCPVCKNEETNIEGDWCQICGVRIVNKCRQQIQLPYDEWQPEEPCCKAAEALPGNARYCPYCGSHTTFLDESLLVKWQDYKPQNPTLDANDFIEEVDDVIPEANKDLPF